jgi:hypothetical protein
MLTPGEIPLPPNVLQMQELMLTLPGPSSGPDTPAVIQDPVATQALTDAHKTLFKHCSTILVRHGTYPVVERKIRRTNAQYLGSLSVYFGALYVKRVRRSTRARKNAIDDIDNFKATSNLHSPALRDLSNEVLQGLESICPNGGLTTGVTLELLKYGDAIKPVYLEGSGEVRFIAMGLEPYNVTSHNLLFEEGPSHAELVANGIAPTDSLKWSSEFSGFRVWVHNGMEVKEAEKFKVGPVQETVVSDGRTFLEAGRSKLGRFVAQSHGVSQLPMSYDGGWFVAVPPKKGFVILLVITSRAIPDGSIFARNKHLTASGFRCCVEPDAVDEGHEMTVEEGVAALIATSDSDSDLGEASAAIRRAHMKRSSVRMPLAKRRRTAHK